MIAVMRMMRSTTKSVTTHQLGGVNTKVTASSATVVSP